jgi:AcrR family transcriptional regulator
VTAQTTAPAVVKTAGAPRSTKGARTRARLLEAAKEIFEEHGFLNARISDISQRANLSHGSFYHYFDSKEQIFREVARAVDDRLSEPLTDIVLDDSSGASPMERLRAALRVHFEQYRDEARIMGVIEQVSRYDAEVSAARQKQHHFYSGKIADSIRALQTRGIADPQLDPAITAAAIGALTFRFAELWLVEGVVDADIDQATEQIARIIVNVMGVPSAAASSRGSLRPVAGVQ